MLAASPRTTAGAVQVEGDFLAGVLGFEVEQLLGGDARRIVVDFPPEEDLAFLEELAAHHFGERQLVG